MASYQITKPFLVDLCYVFFLLILVVATVPAMTFATLDSSSSSQQPEPGPGMQLPPSPLQPQQQQPEQQQQQQQNRSSFLEEFLQQRQIGRSPRQLVLNLSEQMIVQEDAKNTPSLFELVISSDEKSAHIVAGETAQVILTIGLSSGNTQNVTLSCNLTPPSSEGSCNISPSVVTPVGNATLRISTKDTILPGQYTATITATPERGTNRTTNLKVVVDAKPDTTPPVIRLPSSPILVNASGPSGAQVRYQASATDDVDGPINNLTCTPSSGSTFPVGETKVECSAVDTAGNTGTSSFNVTIQDTKPPAISVPTEDITAEATTIGAEGAEVSFNVSAVDNVNGAVDVSCDHNSGETFSIGKTVVTCEATDSSGNAVEKSFNIVVVGPVADDENTPPVITVPTSPIEVEATSNAGGEVNYNVTAFDTEDGSLIPHCDPPSGSIFEIGRSIVKCTVTDSEGTVASTDFPVIIRPPPQALEEEPVLPLIVVIALVIIAAAIVVVIIIILRKRRRSSTGIDDDDEEETKDDGTQVYD